MDCKKCGEETFVIHGLCFDRDGMRNSRFCNYCKTVFSVHAHGMDVKYLPKDSYAGSAKERIEAALERALAELRA